MKRANVKFVPDSGAGCVVVHTYDSEIENSTNSEEEKDEDGETESEQNDKIPIIMKPMKRERINSIYEKVVFPRCC